mgnify:CR=1 FL=1
MVVVGGGGALKQVVEWWLQWTNVINLFIQTRNFRYVRYLGVHQV